MVRQYVWGVVVVLALLAGCSGKKRSFGEVVEGNGVDVGDVGAMAPDAAPQPGAAVGSSETPPDPNLLGSSEPTNGVPPGSLGAPCTSPSQCNAPGFCVDGVCCSSACNEICAACDVPGSLGTCSAAPSDAACGELACAGFDTECRKLDTSQLALNCEAFGACKVNADCAATSEAASKACQAGTGTCNGTGACLVAGKASLGETCAADVDCAEGHCIPGDGGALVCCDAACDSPCQACNAAGHCEATPSTDSRCEAVACPADDVCRDYTADTIVSQCRSFGQCQTGSDCPHEALRPDAECECDATTAACRLRPGASCTEADQCASGVCTANAEGTSVCCSSACAEGLFCSSDGASCVACEGNAISCEGNTELRCDAGVIGRTECRNGCTSGVGCNGLPPLGFLCEAGQCAAPNVCQPDVAGASRCCSRNCAAEGKVCAENGSCACREGEIAAGNDCLLQNGDPCASSQQCQAGSTCSDGVCCQQACNGSCERCEPNTGLCVAIAAGQTDNTCNNGRQCVGARGDCRLNNRQPCSGNGAECTSNSCEPTVGNATQICCSQSCSGNRPFCRSNGQGCVQCETNADCGNGCNTQTGVCNDLLPIGATCGTTPQCASGAQCLFDQGGQTRCCERNCAAMGMVCNGQGRCATTQVGNGQACGETAICNAALGLQCIGGTCGCAPGQQFARGQCRVAGGQPCPSNGAAGCADNVCTEWLVDVDADGIGSFGDVLGGVDALFICGDTSLANEPLPFLGPGCRGGTFEHRYVPRSAASQGRLDCCDLDYACGFVGFSPNQVPSTVFFPGQNAPQAGFGAGPLGTGCSPAQDYDCNGDAVPVAIVNGSGVVTNCTQPRCAERFNKVRCDLASAASCTQNSGVQGPEICGTVTDVGCSVSAAGACRTQGAGQITVLCL